MAEKKTFEIPIEPGMHNGHKIVLRGEAGCTEPGLQPGDVVLVVQQREHDTFKRLQHNHIDLVMQKHVSLQEALCGTAFTVKHLDGRILKVTTEPGEVIKPDSFRVIQEEGMPAHGRPFLKGNLYIQFEVGFTSLALQLGCTVSCVSACMRVLAVLLLDCNSLLVSSLHAGFF